MIFDKSFHNGAEKPTDDRNNCLRKTVRSFDLEPEIYSGTIDLRKDANYTELHIVLQDLIDDLLETKEEDFIRRFQLIFRLSCRKFGKFNILLRIDPRVWYNVNKFVYINEIENRANIYINKVKVTEKLINNNKKIKVLNIKKSKNNKVEWHCTHLIDNNGQCNFEVLRKNFIYYDEEMKFYLSSKIGNKYTLILCPLNHYNQQEFVTCSNTWLCVNKAIKWLQNSLNINYFPLKMIVINVNEYMSQYPIHLQHSHGHIQLILNHLAINACLNNIKFKSLFYPENLPTNYRLDDARELKSYIDDGIIGIQCIE
ncbi:unnamed protein product [Didymodactylos carnosus]|nr:unnamed protein product [Didymodactylos carnosus]CAF4191138.1 unnamed protein product [Didymodactylos carnosus]